MISIIISAQVSIVSSGDAPPHGVVNVHDVEGETVFDNNSLEIIHLLELGLLCSILNDTSFLANFVCKSTDISPLITF